MDPKNIISHGGRRSGAAFSLCIILYILLSFAVQLAALAAFGKGSVGYSALCSLASVTAITVTIIIFAKSTGRKLTDITGYKRFDGIYLVFAFMFSAGMFFGFGFINQRIAEVFSSWGLSVSEAEIPLSDPLSLVIFTITLAILPAVIEEAFFRGLVLEGLKGIKAVYAILCVSAVFAVYHCSATQFFYQLIYGGALTLLALKSGSVLPSVAAHFLNNFTVIMLTYFSVSAEFLYKPAVIAAGMAVTLAAVAVAYFYRPKKTDGKDDTGNSADGRETEEKTVSRFFVYALPGIVFCVVLAVSALVV